MSQTFHPYGFSLIESYESRPSYGLHSYLIQDQYNQSLGAGDPVSFVIAANNSNGYVGRSLSIDQTVGAVTVPPIVGIFNGCSYQPLNAQLPKINSMMWTANIQTFAAKGASAKINDFPLNVYKVQMATYNGGGVPTPVVGASIAFIGQNFNVSYQAPNGSTSQSQSYLNAGYIPVAQAVAINVPFKVIGLAQGSQWTDPYPEVLVIINSHFMKPGTASLTV